MLFLVAIAGISLAAQTASETHAERAVELVQSGQLKEAESELKRAVVLASRDPAIVAALGVVLAMESKLADAEPYLEKAVALMPLDLTMRRNLAVNQWHLGKLQESRANLERVLESEPDDRQAILFLGMVAENQHRYAEAVRLLASVPDLTRQNSVAQIAFASALYAAGNKAEARAQLTTVHDDDESLFLAARTASEAADYETSLTILGPLLAATVSDRSQNLAAHDLLKMGKTREALAVSTEACKRFPSSVQSFAQKGASAMRLGYFLDAAAAYKQACRLDSNSAGLIRALGVAQWKAGERGDSIGSFQNLLRRFPQDAASYEAYGTLLADSGDEASIEKGARLLRKAHAIDPALPATNLYLGNLAMNSGRNEDALHYFESGLRNDPGNPKLHFALSRALRRLGRVADSDRELEAYRGAPH